MDDLAARMGVLADQMSVLAGQMVAVDRRVHLNTLGLITIVFVKLLAYPLFYLMWRDNQRTKIDNKSLLAEMRKVAQQNVEYLVLIKGFLTLGESEREKSRDKLLGKIEEAVEHGVDKGIGKLPVSVGSTDEATGLRTVDLKEPVIVRPVDGGKPSGGM